MVAPVTRVLFVCTGNICRSPMAEGVLRDLAARSGMADRVEVDSAGTIQLNIGQPPAEPAIRVARQRGVDLSGIRARQVHGGDFVAFDLIVGMDESHRRYLRANCPPSMHRKICLLMEFAPAGSPTEVPDPYLEPIEQFERVLTMIETGVTGLWQRISAA
jgi:protein-tyrosine phosphatase